MGVFFLMTTSKRPLRTFNPMFRGTTSSRKNFWIYLSLCPDKMAAWMAAPAQTASSGFTEWLSGFPKYV